MIISHLIRENNIINIEKHLDNNNWFHYADFYDYVASHKHFKNLVEVGVWKGHSISYLAKKIQEHTTDVNLYAVDLFSESPDFKKFHSARSELPIIYDIYNENLRRAGVRDMIKDIKGWSWEVADQFENESLDFVYLDASHDTESVIKDINAWLPKVKPGGLFSGHDGWNEHVEAALEKTNLIQDIKYFHANKQVWYIWVES